jgi:hypothetical protein
LADWTPLVVVNAVLLVGFVGFGLRAAWSAARSAPRPERVGAAAVAGLALALAEAAPWGPEEVNSVSKMSNPLLGATAWVYGAGQPAWGLLVHGLVPGPPDDRTLMELDPFVHAVAAVAVLAAVRGVGVPALGAFAAGAAAAALAPLVRFAHTDGPHALEALLTWGGLALLLRHARRPSWADALGGAGAVAVAAQLRPEAVFLLVPALGLLLAAPERPPWRHPATWTALVLVAGLAVAHLIGAWTLLQGPPQPRPRLLAGNGAPHPLFVHGPRHLVFLEPAHVSAVLGALAAVGLVAGRAAARLRLALAAGALGLAVLVGGPPHYTVAWGATPVMLRFQLRALPWFAALVGLGSHRVAAAVGGRAGAALAVGALAVGLAGPLPDALTPRTHTLEYRFFREHLLELPAPCTVSAYLHPRDAGFAADTYDHLGPWAGHDVRTRPLTEPDPVGCHVYYRAANCSLRAEPVDLAEGGAPSERCAAWEDAHALTPRVTAELPARPFGLERYGADPVRVGFFTVDGPAGADDAPRSGAEPVVPSR